MIIVATRAEAGVNGCRLPTGNRNAQGALPANFFAISLPQGSALANANSYNILTLNGYKQYTLASANGTGFGDLGIKSASRYVQFGLGLLGCRLLHQ